MQRIVQLILESFGPRRDPLEHGSKERDLLMSVSMMDFGLFQ